MTIALDLIIQLLTFALVSLLTVAAIRGVGGQMAVRRRLAEADAVRPVGGSPLIRQQAVVNPFLKWVEDSTLNDDKEKSKLRRDLAQAGFDHPSAPIFYVLLRFGLAIGLPLLFVVSQQFAVKPMEGMGAIMMPLMLCAGGLSLPNMALKRRVDARKSEVEDQFPDALDLLVICIESGLGAEAAFVRVSQEVTESHPRIAYEFGRLTSEISAGRAMSDALRRMADRVDVDSVKSFAALMIQTEALGVSIGQTLRSFSNEMRDHRFLRAEEKAMRIPVLMTIPLVACFLPVIVTALLLPAVIDVIRVVMPSLNP